MPLTRNQLLAAAQALCADFAAKKDIDVLLSHFSTTYECTAFEHGEPCLAPFLGRAFSGRTDGVRRYFELLGALLKYDDMRFSQWCVDGEARRVCVKGAARFTWKETGEEWDERFAYMLDFDEEGKVAEYQVWADSGAAYLAKLGKLEECKKMRSDVVD